MPLSISCRPLSAALCVVATGASALAQGFAPGMTLFSIEPGLQWNAAPALSDDGTAIGNWYYNPVTHVSTGVTIRQNGMTVLPTPCEVDDVSDGGLYNVEYITRRDDLGNAQTMLPGVTVPSALYVKSYISGDGSVVAGTRQDQPDWPCQAFRWTATGGGEYLDLYRFNALYTNARGISRDGSTIVGDGSMYFGAVTEAWKWTEASGYTYLQAAPGSRPLGTRAYACNSDGSIVVGYDMGPAGFGSRAVVWHDSVATALPIPTGYRSCDAYDLSDDGSIIIGTLSSSQVGLPETSAIWTTTGGWIPALDYIRQQGIDVPSYFDGRGRFEVSADGQVFSTQLRDTRTSQTLAAVFVVPAPGSVVLLGLSMASTRRSRNASPPSPNARRG